MNFSKIRLELKLGIFLITLKLETFSFFQIRLELATFCCNLPNYPARTDIN